MGGRPLIPQALPGHLRILIETEIVLAGGAGVVVRRMSGNRQVVRQRRKLDDQRPNVAVRQKPPDAQIEMLRQQMILRRTRILVAQPATTQSQHKQCLNKATGDDGQGGADVGAGLDRKAAVRDPQ